MKNRILLKIATLLLALGILACSASGLERDPNESLLSGLPSVVANASPKALCPARELFVLTENGRFSEVDTDRLSASGEPLVAVSCDSSLVQIELILPSALSSLLFPANACGAETAYRFDLEIGLASEGALSTYSPCTTSFFFSPKDRSCVGVYGIRNKRVNGVTENIAILSSFASSRGEAFVDSLGNRWDAEALSSSSACEIKDGGLSFQFTFSLEELASLLPSSERDAYLNPVPGELRYGYFSLSVPIQFSDRYDSSLLCIGIPKEKAAFLSVGSTTLLKALNERSLSDSELPSLLPIVFLLQGSIDPPTASEMTEPVEETPSSPALPEVEKEEGSVEAGSDPIAPTTPSVTADRVVVGDLPEDVFWEELPDDFEDVSDATEIVYFSSVSEDGVNSTVLGPILLCFAGVLLLVSVIVAASIFRNDAKSGKNDAKKQNSKKK